MPNFQDQAAEISEKNSPGLSEGQIKAILNAERSAALGTTTASDLSMQRIRAMKYYLSEMEDDLPAPPERSQAVSTDVQDTVEGVLPIILDIFVSSDEAVKFQPQNAQDVEAAKQETDYVNHVFYQRNGGFVVLYSFIKDALLSKNGFVKMWWEKSHRWERESYRGLTADAYALIVDDDTVEIVKENSYPDPNWQPPVNQPGMPPVEQTPQQTLYDCTVRSKKTSGQAKVMAVPPEEILVSKNARTDVQDWTYWAHVTRKPQSDLLEAYPDQADAIEAAPSASVVSDNAEAYARQTVQDTQDLVQTGEDINRAMRLVEVTEHYLRLDMDGTGIAERWRITTVGESTDIIDMEPMDRWPLATMTPIIMTHRAFGRSLADLVEDIQRIKTSLLRAMLDNAYMASNQRMEVPESHSTEDTLDDVMNNRPGGLVRTKMPGGLTPIENSPIGNWVMPLVEYMDSVRENRTGVSRYNQGLDGDSLNQTAHGIERIMSAAEMRIKLMARIFAETGIREMFLGLHALILKHSEEPDVFELRNKWITVDPREWNTRNHMTANVALGSGGKASQQALLAQLLGIQQQIIEVQGGPTGPLITMDNVYNTLAAIIELGGYKNTDSFITDPAGQPMPPPKPDPQAAAIQAKSNAEIQALQAKGQIEAQLAQQRQQADIELGNMKLQHEMEIERMRATSDMQIASAKAAADIEVKRTTAAHNASLKQQAADAAPIEEAA